MILFSPRTRKIGRLDPDIACGNFNFERMMLFDNENVWHEGELEVQHRAGVASKAEELTGMIRTALPPSAQAFLSQRQFAVVSTIDKEGAIWASVLTGEPGFISVPDPRSIEARGGWVSSDPLVANLERNSNLGMLVIDFATRRRMRANGLATIRDGERLLLQLQQAYSNCPRYIQARTPYSVLPPTNAVSISSKNLTEAQRDWIRSSDTFFIATAHPERGADASHRGGSPGFVRVEGDRLIIPDYNGNSIFNTLGNIHVYPRGGLLFVNFESGRTLQLSGAVNINWDTEAARRFNRAERLLEVQIGKVIETENGSRLAFRFDSYSPFNPTI